MVGKVAVVDVEFWGVVIMLGDSGCGLCLCFSGITKLLLVADPTFFGGVLIAMVHSYNYSIFLWNASSAEVCWLVGVEAS